MLLTTAISQRFVDHILIVAAFVASAVSPLATAEEAADYRLVTRSAHDRSMTTLYSGATPICGFYAHGTLTTKAETTEEGHEWTGGIVHNTEYHNTKNSEPKTYTIAFSRTAPVDVLVDGRPFRVLKPAKSKSDVRPRCPVFVLTSYGRAVPTGRSFQVSDDDSELDPKRQYSHAWYFDNDLYDAETSRNTLEMDDLESWVIAWDEQHPIQHSDGARVAKIRVFRDGRVVINSGYRTPLGERKISPDEVATLLNDLAKMKATHQSGLPDVTIELTEAIKTATEIKPEALNINLVSPLGRGMWDQHQDLVRFQHDGETQSLRVVHKGGDQRPTSIPIGWDEMRERLSQLIRTATR